MCSNRSIGIKIIDWIKKTFILVKVVIYLKDEIDLIISIVN